MVDRRIMAGVLAGGLAIGLAGGWAIWGQRPDIPATVMSLIEERCVPYVTGAAEFDASGLEPISGYYESDDFVEPDTLIMVSVQNATRCRVTDRLAVWPDADRDAVYGVIATNAASWVAVNNDGDMVVEDLGSEAAWTTFLNYRPMVGEGHYLTAITEGPEVDSDGIFTTTITIGHGTFTGPARILEGQNA